RCGNAVVNLRETEGRQEASEAGVARLVGGAPAGLALMLEEAYREGRWIRSVGQCANPFGRGDSGKRIAHIIAGLLDESPVVPRSLVAVPGGEQRVEDASVACESALLRMVLLPR